jgi:hypothetical protein
MLNEPLYKEIFSIVENRVYVKCPYIRILIPEKYLDKKLLIIEGNEIDILGIFYFNVYGLDKDKFNIEDPYKYQKKFFLKVPSYIRMKPNNLIEERDAEKGKTLIFEFNCNDIFINSLNVKKDWKVVNSIMHMLIDGFLPDSINYDDIINLLNDACTTNGMDLKIVDVITEVLIAELNRDPTNIKNAFRFAIKNNPKISMNSSKKIRAIDLAKYMSNFAAISSGDAKTGITLSINRQHRNEPEQESSIEKAIKNV